MVAEEKAGGDNFYDKGAMALELNRGVSIIGSAYQPKGGKWTVNKDASLYGPVNLLLHHSEGKPPQAFHFVLLLAVSSIVAIILWLRIRH